jgi:hypothetical protein
MSKRKAVEKPQPRTKRQRVESESRARGELLIRATRAKHIMKDFDLWVDPKVVRAVSYDWDGPHGSILRLHGQHTQYFFAEKFDVSEIRAAWEDETGVFGNPRFRMGHVLYFDIDDDADVHEYTVVDIPNDDEVGAGDD